MSHAGTTIERIVGHLDLQIHGFLQLCDAALNALPAHRPMKQGTIRYRGDPGQTPRILSSGGLMWDLPNTLVSSRFHASKTDGS
jgi:hypothetical protein